jgi:hypothetical protein
MIPFYYSCVDSLTPTHDIRLPCSQYRKFILLPAMIIISREVESVTTRTPVSYWTVPGP